MFSRPSNSIKGLSIFISDLRDCVTVEDEARRVNAEFGKILTKFAQPSLSGYDYKKYIYKLIYAYILGYDAEVGRMQAMNLLVSAKLSEKTAGYLGLNILASGDPETLRLALSSVKTDLGSSNELVVGLALNFVGNTANSDFVKSILPEIVRLLDANAPTSLYTRRKVIMCLLRLAQNGYVMEFEQWSENLCSFLAEADTGIVNATASVVLHVLKEEDKDLARWTCFLDAAIKTLIRINTNQANYSMRGAHYYGVIHPWLQVKLLAITTKFPISLYSAEQLVEINELIGVLFVAHASISLPGEMLKPARTVRAELDRINRLTGEHCVLFAATETAFSLEKSLTAENRKTIGQFLVNSISERGPNIKYLALELLGRLANTTAELAAVDPALSAFERKLFERCRSVVVSEIVGGVDTGSRRAALAVLVATCDKSNWETVVEELLTVLGTLPKETVRCSLKNSTSFYAAGSSRAADSLALLKEELSLQISLIAERHAPDSSWNVDILFRCLKFAPAFVPDSVVRRVLGLIADKPGATSSSSSLIAGQSQAAERSYEALGGKLAKLPSVSQNVLTLAMFVLGEYGWRLVENKRVSALRLVEVISGHLSAMDHRKGVGLFALAKIAQRFSDLAGVKDETVAVIESYTDALDFDTSQRANELMALFRNPALSARLFTSSPASRVSFCVPAQQTSSVSEEDEPVDPKTLWRYLCVKPDGVLFSSESVEVRVLQQTYTAAGTGRLVLQLSARKELRDVAVSVATVGDGVLVSEDRKFDLIPVLSANQSVQHTLTVKLQSPFLNPPKFILKYAGTTLPLSLPVIITKFARPSSAGVTPEDFSARWPLFQAEDASIQAQMAVAANKFPGYLVHGFGFSLVSGSGGGGRVEAVTRIGEEDVLLRVETASASESGSVRLSVRAKNAMLARYVANIVASYFCVSGK